MGNQLTLPQKLQPEHLAEVPKFVLKENLGEGSEVVGRTNVLCIRAKKDYRQLKLHED